MTNENIDVDLTDRLVEKFGKQQPVVYDAIIDIIETVSPCQWADLQAVFNYELQRHVQMATKDGCM